MIINWQFFDFHDLSKFQLHEIMKFRQAIFIVEQDCPYQDADEKDKDSFHLLGFDESQQLVAYLRLVKEGISYDEISFGRIATHLSVRGKGVGKDLMEEGIRQANNLYGKPQIRISAQSYLVPFYKAFNFKSTGKEYLEDDIPHTEMLRV